MVRPQSIATDYRIYSDPDFLTLAENIVAGITGNHNYSNPPTPPAELGELLAALDAASKAMKTGLKSATSQRDYLRAQAETAVKALSAYATGATPERPDLWAAANFPLTKAETTPRLASQPVTGLALADGSTPRTLQASVDMQAGMYGYAWRLYPRATTAEALAAGFCYRFCLTRQPKVLIDNLDSGTPYGVECAAWNDTGALQWSVPVFRIVQ